MPKQFIRLAKNLKLAFFEIGTFSPITIFGYIIDFLAAGGDRGTFMGY